MLNKELLRCKRLHHIYLHLPRGGSPDERFKETPRAFPIKSNRRATFDTVPGSMSGFGGSRPGTGPGPTGSRRFTSKCQGVMYYRRSRRTSSRTSGVSSISKTDPAKEAASVREKSKKDYAKALNKAATTPRSFMPETVKIQDLHKIKTIYIYQK